MLIVINQLPSCNGKFSYQLNIIYSLYLEKGEGLRIQIQLAVSGEMVKQDVLEIAEYKLGEMTDEEIESAIEIKIRTWVDRMVQVEWEVLE